MVRVLLRIIAPLLAFALAVAGGLLAVEVIAAWTVGGGPSYRGLVVPWRTWQALATQLSWSAVGSIAVCVAVGVFGVVLLWVAIFAGRGEIRLNDPSAHISVTASARVLAWLASQHLRGIDQIISADVRASSRVVRIRAIGRGEQPTSLRPVVRRRAGELLTALPLVRQPRLSVSVRAERGLR